MAKRRHHKKIPVTRDQAVRFSCQCSLKQLVVVRVATLQWGAAYLNCFPRLYAAASLKHA